MDIPAQFDQAFRVAQQSKHALAAGDKPAAFRLLKDAIALFMGVFPHVPDMRTKNLVAAECDKLMTRAEELKREIEAEHTQQQRFAAARAQFQAHAQAQARAQAEAQARARAAAPAPSAPRRPPNAANGATGATGDQARVPDLLSLPTPPSGDTGGGTGGAGGGDGGGEAGFYFPPAPTDTPRPTIPSLPSAPTDTPRPGLPSLPSAPTHTPRRLVGVGGDDDAGGGGAGLITVFRPDSKEGDEDADAAAAAAAAAALEDADVDGGGGNDPPASLEDILARLPAAPGVGTPVAGGSTAPAGGKEADERVGAAAGGGGGGGGDAAAELAAERAARQDLEQRMHRMSKEMKHLRIRHGVLGDEFKDGGGTAPRRSPARSVTYTKSSEGKSKEVTALPGVTCVLPACVSVEKGTYRAPRTVFSVDAHGSLRFQQQEAAHGGPGGCLLRVLPVHKLDVDAFSARIHAAARLTHGFTDVPSLRAVARVYFDASGAFITPHDADTAVAVLELPCSVAESKSCIGDYIAKDAARAAAVGAGGGAGAGAGGGAIAAGDAARAVLPCGYAPWDVQGVFLQLAQALALLHNGHLTGCLDRRAVTVDVDANRVVVCPVEMPPSSSSAPEVESGGSVNEAADVYTFAAWVFEAHFGASPVLMPGEERVKVGNVPYHDDQYSDRVSNLLVNCLTRDPTQRLSAAEVSIHPCFTKSLVADFQSSRVILETERKREALYECIQAMRVPDKRLRVTVMRTMLVDTTVEQIMSAPKAQLGYRFDVKFHGEPGIDAGGLTCELFQQFFESLFGDGCDLFARAAARSERPLFLPNPEHCDGARLDAGRARLYEGVGRMLVKSIFDGHPVPVAFAPSLYKFLLALPPNLHDLEAFDPDIHHQCVETLHAAPEDMELLALDFDEVGEPARDVTAANRHEYVTKLINYTLVDCRKPALAAMKKGFDSLGIAAHLRLFTCTELMALVCGQQTVSAEELVARTVFERFPAGSPTPGLFRAVLRRLNSAECKRFLVFATAQSALPLAGNNIVIRFHPDPSRYPTAHTCFRRIDLPNLTDQAEIERRLRFCLENLELSGFGEQ